MVPALPSLSALSSEKRGTMRALHAMAMSSSSTPPTCGGREMPASRSTRGGVRVRVRVRVGVRVTVTVGVGVKQRVRIRYRYTYRVRG